MLSFSSFTSLSTRIQCEWPTFGSERPMILTICKTLSEMILCALFLRGVSFRVFNGQMIILLCSVELTLHSLQDKGSLFTCVSGFATSTTGNGVSSQSPHIKASYQSTRSASTFQIGTVSLRNITPHLPSFLGNRSLKGRASSTK